MLFNGICVYVSVCCVFFSLIDRFSVVSVCVIGLSVVEFDMSVLFMLL